ncbi:MAG: metalloregulator ArsR/SmtB family transcription factor [Planctomycetota bacterium]
MTTLDLTFSALADPTRRQILARLAKGSATVSELVSGFKLTQPTISSHLKLLERAGLISRSRVRQTRPCALEPAGLHALQAWLGDVHATYQQNYERLDGVLDTLKAQSEHDDA